MKAIFSHRGKIYPLDIQQSGQEYFLEKDGKRVVARLTKSDQPKIGMEIDGRVQEVMWAKQGRKIWLHIDGRSYDLEKQASTGAVAGLAAGERILRAPMPGQVRQVMVQEGAPVQAGETLVLLEAMKMEIRIQAPSIGKVTRVAVKHGQTVEKEQVLVELES